MAERVVLGFEEEFIDGDRHQDIVRIWSCVFDLEAGVEVTYAWFLSESWLILLEVNFDMVDSALKPDRIR